MAKRDDRESRQARERLRVYSARKSVHEAGVRRRRLDNVLAVIGAVVLVGLAGGAQFLYFNAGPGAPKPTASASSSPSPSAGSTAEANKNVGNVPSTSLAANRDWTGTLTLNNTVKLGVTLNGAKAPQAVSVVLQGVNSGYYTGKSCHRLVNQDSFGVLQCGSKDGTGASDASFSYGPVENAPSNGIYPAGTIAMARASSAYSNGYQFFICYKQTTLPDATGYSVVGTVTSGLDTLVSQIVDKGIQQTAGQASATIDGKPVVATTITGFSLK